jgi:hypothetical protein
MLAVSPTHNFVGRKCYHNSQLIIAFSDKNTGKAYKEV